ncbi:MAG: MFS transporter [Lentisphaeraceae bacterium]|nr:MFS transporter [Lentisphaeraceae bacterium]
MSENSNKVELTSKEKAMLFWASFLSLTAAGVGFVLRSLGGNTFWGSHFEISDGQVSALFGAGLWPIAITMIVFSLLVDKIGYKASMFCAFALQSLGAVLTIFAGSFEVMMAACLVSGLGHGIVEAVINPLCASIYREEKSKWLNILHASWPAGIVIGGVVWLTIFRGGDGMDWAGAAPAFWFMFAPVLGYGVMFFLCKKFPVDERIENDIPMSEMLKEFGGLGAFIAITFFTYEIINQLVGYKVMSPLEGSLFFWPKQLEVCVLIGIVGGTIFGSIIKAKGKILFFVLCLIMIPLATAEIATDGWIQALMKPTMGKFAGWALVFSASIMMILRFFAGVPLKYMSPPGLLLLSSVFSIVGLFALAAVDGGMVWVAFVFYAVGQTFYWPTVLGFVSEQFPKGGAMTLNTVSAMGLLTVGIFGFAFLGTAKDAATVKYTAEKQPELVEKVKEEKITFTNKKGEEQQIIDTGDFFGIPYLTINQSEFEKLLPGDAAAKTAAAAELQAHLDQTVGRSVLRRAALLPSIMAICFILIIIYFKSQGGYKPVVLSAAKGDNKHENPEGEPIPAVEL